MQPIVHYPYTVLAAVSGAEAALRGHLHCLRRSTSVSRRAPVKAAAPTPRLEPGREWDMVVGRLARDLSRVPDIAAIQAHAALKIDAAEHALNRIIADCAKVLAPTAAPALRPPPGFVHRSESQMRRPLAA